MSRSRLFAAAFLVAVLGPACAAPSDEQGGPSDDAAQAVSGASYTRDSDYFGILEVDGKPTCSVVTVAKDLALASGACAHLDPKHSKLRVTVSNRSGSFTLPVVDAKAVVYAPKDRFVDLAVLTLDAAAAAKATVYVPRAAQHPNTQGVPGVLAAHGPVRPGASWTAENWSFNGVPWVTQDYLVFDKVAGVGDNSRVEKARAALDAYLASPAPKAPSDPLLGEDGCLFQTPVWPGLGGISVAATKEFVIVLRLDRDARIYQSDPFLRALLAR
jgi:hypothetical protein